MSEQETPAIAEPAKTQTEPNSAAVRKAKSKLKAKRATKRGNTHEGRPKSSLSYWKAAIENNRLRGPELFYAIRKVEDYERKKAQEKLTRTPPNPEKANKLRAILGRDTKSNEPLKTEPIAQTAKPQTLAQLQPEITESPAEPKPLSFEDVMAEIVKPSGKTRAEEVAEIAARSRDVPASEPDARTKNLIDRAWSKVH